MGLCSTKLNVCAHDGVQLWERASISAIPELATIALLGLGGMLLRHRR